MTLSIDLPVETFTAIQILTLTHRLRIPLVRSVFPFGLYVPSTAVWNRF